MPLALIIVALCLVGAIALLVAADRYEARVYRSHEEHDEADASERLYPHERGR